MVDDGAFAPVANFEVRIQGPIVQTASGYNQAELLYRADGIVIPGRRIGAMPFSAYGPPRQFAIGQEMSGVSVRIKCSEDLSEKIFFETWQDLAIGDARKRSTVTEGMFDIGYYDNYRGAVEIIQYSPDDLPVFTCQLLEAWPVMVSDLEGAWESDGHHRLRVDFEYYRFIDDVSTGIGV